MQEVEGNEFICITGYLYFPSLKHYMMHSRSFLGFNNVVRMRSVVFLYNVVYYALLLSFYCIFTTLFLYYPK